MKQARFVRGQRPFVVGGRPADKKATGCMVASSRGERI
jgi:hypothetical protein